jgi:hypothetical protein
MSTLNEDFTDYLLNVTWLIWLKFKRPAIRVPEKKHLSEKRKSV